MAVEGNTELVNALCDAVAKDDKETILSLINAGADVNGIKESSINSFINEIFTSRPRRKTPLYLASYDNNLEISRILIEKGADVNKRSIDGATPLFAASLKGHLEVAKLLIEYKADVNISAEDGTTALWTAAKNGHLTVVQLLVKNGGHLDVRALGHDNYTPLCIAIEKGHLDITSFLIANGADIQKCAKSNASPLHFACARGRQDMAFLLIKKGADIHATTDDGTTPLHQAVGAECSPELIEALLLSGADVEARDKRGVTALSMVKVKRNRVEIKELILSWPRWGKHLRTMQAVISENRRSEAYFIEAHEKKEAKIAIKIKNTADYIREIETKVKEENEEKLRGLEQLRRKVKFKIEQKEEEVRQLKIKVIDVQKRAYLLRSRNDLEDIDEELNQLYRDHGRTEGTLAHFKDTLDEIKAAYIEELEAERRKSKLQLEKTRDELLQEGERRVAKLEARILELEREKQVLLERFSGCEEDLKHLSVEYEETSTSDEKVVKLKGAAGSTEGIEALKELLRSVAQSSHTTIYNTWSLGPVTGSITGDVNSVVTNS